MVGCGYRLDEINQMPGGQFLAYHAQAMRRLKRQKSSAIYAAFMGARAKADSVTEAMKGLNSGD